MEAIQLIVTALAAGATTAVIENRAGEAVKAAYDKLKALIKTKYPAVQIDSLEAKPDSAARKAVLQEDLETTAAATDTELQQQAKSLLDALKEELAAAPNQVIGINLADIEAASSDLSNIIAQGDGSSDVTGVNIKGAKIAGELKISGITANAGPTLPSAQLSAQLPTPPPESSQSSGSSSAPSPIKILFLAANPTDTTRLRVDEEIRGIDDALRKSNLRDRFELIPHGAVRIEDLQPLLMRHDPHIVHFSGHGEKDEIILQDASGKGVAVGREALAGLFGILKDNIRCVVLNACYSEPQAKAIGQHIDIVIGMSDSILDDSARHFSHSFYQALGYGKNMQRAFDLGKNSIDLQNLGEAYKLQLMHKIDPRTLVLT